MTQQIQMFEPTGAEVMALATAHAKSAEKAFRLAESLDVAGWGASARLAYREFHRCERLSAEMYMLAEFEALGGVA